MRKSDYSHIGRKVKRAVQDAVHSGNFENVGRVVDDTVREVADEVNEAFSGRHSEQTHPPHPYASNESQSGNPYYGYTSQTPPPAQGYHAPSHSDTVSPGSSAYENPAVWPRHSRRHRSMLHSRMPGGIAGTLCSVFGLILGVPMLIADVSLIAAAGAQMMAMHAFLAGSAVMFPMTAASFGVAGYGKHLRNRARRFERYQAALGGAAFGRVEDLAAAADETPERTVKDLKKMIDTGVYPNGHLNQEMTCFMVDNETYQEYLDAERARLKREKACHDEEEKHKTDPQQAELEAVRREGNDYLLEIHAANAAIPGKEISQKLSELETVTGRILDCIEQHPKKLPEIRKFMRYYLPTTLKLVQSYQEFDTQPVQGENITQAKTEIAQALDTINAAFANLLDSLFADDALDISTDISALETMLKQEGLTGSDFQKKPEDSPDLKL